MQRTHELSIGRTPKGLANAAGMVLAICAHGTTSLMDWICGAEVEHQTDRGQF